MKTIVLMTIERSKNIQDFLDKLGGRVYSMDGVEDVTTSLVFDSQNEALSEVSRLGQKMGPL